MKNPWTNTMPIQIPSTVPYMSFDYIWYIYIYDSIIFMCFFKVCPLCCVFLVVHPYIQNANQTPQQNQPEDPIPAIHEE